MGLVKKMRSLTGAPPKELLQNGLLGRGIVTQIQRTSVSVGVGANMALVCEFTVEVSLDGEPRYSAGCRQAVQITQLPALMSPGATVAVRVDPADHSRIVLSLGEEPPIVTMSKDDPNTGSAATILERGEPCDAVIVETLPLGTRSSRTGDEMYAFSLTVMAHGRAPYHVDVGNPVPKPALPLLYPGNKLPAKRLPDADDRMLAIDWTAALAQTVPTHT